MARELRPRKARPSYAVPLVSDSDDEAVLIGEGSSSDDFRPPDHQENEDAGDESSQGGDVPSEDEDVDVDDVLIVHDTSNKKKKSRTGSEKQKMSSSSSFSFALSSVLSRPDNRQQYALPIPAPDHRHRASPLYWRAARVERLIQPPKPFGPSATAPTNNWTFTKVIMDRYNKASGHNVGRGPIWDFMEDRSWWKESKVVAEGETETEGTRRPRVHKAVKVDKGLQIIDGQEAKVYIPSNSNSSTPSSVKCSFGFPGKHSPTEMKIFYSMNMSEYVHGSNALVFHAGGPVWGLDWCPIYVEDRPHRSYKQYIAVAPLPSNVHTPEIGVKCSTPSPACIQIWSYGPKPVVQSVGTSENISVKGKEKATGEDDSGMTKCELVLCIDCGPAQEIKWCPLPSNDSWAGTHMNDVRKIGLLAGTFEDGSMSIFVVPDPDDLRSQMSEGPIYVKIKPIIRIELEETSIWALDWANSERLACGCSNGSIAIYDIKDVLEHEFLRELLPTHYFSVHQSAIRTLQWIQVPRASSKGLLQFTEDPVIIASGGYDGCEILTDLREGSGSIVNRTRDVALALAYSRYSTGVISIDLDNIVKTFTLSPSMLGRGHILIDAGGPIWSIHTSDYHPQLAIGSADGSVLTTNILKSTRRSAATPFLFYRLFQLDYNRKTGEYRMMEQFLPQEVADKSSSGKKKAAESASHLFGTGAWSSEVSVTRVVWNNGGGLARAPLLASATASGLCRIDWLLGHFQKGKVPYGGIEYIRKEVESGKMEEDDD